MDKLLSELKNIKDRSAKFTTIITLNLKTERKIFEGTVKGTIIHQKKGNKGFGYDPIFKPADYNTTFAELPLAIKNKISHRGKAIQQLVQYLKSLENAS